MEQIKLMNPRKSVMTASDTRTEKNVYLQPMRVLG